MLVDDALTLLEAHGIPLDRTLAWTKCYFPFVMGGNVWQDAGAEIPCDRPIYHNGAWIALCRGPNGMTKVVHFDSGAIVGDTLEQVMADIDSADPEVMDQQLQAARQRRDNVKRLEPDDLWKRLANGRD